MHLGAGTTRMHISHASAAGRTRHHLTPISPLNSQTLSNFGVGLNFEISSCRVRGEQRPAKRPISLLIERRVGWISVMSEVLTEYWFLHFLIWVPRIQSMNPSSKLWVQQQQTRWYKGKMSDMSNEWTKEMEAKSERSHLNSPPSSPRTIVELLSIVLNELYWNLSTDRTGARAPVVADQSAFTLRAY